jgi:hypothetical protein
MRGTQLAMFVKIPTAWSRIIRPVPWYRYTRVTTGPPAQPHPPYRVRRAAVTSTIVWSMIRHPSTSLKPKLLSGSFAEPGQIQNVRLPVRIAEDVGGLQAKASYQGPISGTGHPAHSFLRVGETLKNQAWA